MFDLRHQQNVKQTINRNQNSNSNKTHFYILYGKKKELGQTLA
jgi:hypothetical protein